MISSRSAWVLLTTRPPARILSRRLLDHKFGPNPAQFSCSASRRWPSPRLRVDTKKGAGTDLLEQQLDQLQDNYLEDAYEEAGGLDDDNFKVNIFDQDIGGKTASVRTHETELDDADEKALEEGIAELEADDVDDIPTEMSDEDRQDIISQLDLSAADQSQLLSRLHVAETDDIPNMLRSQNLLRHHVKSNRTLPHQSELMIERLNEILDEASLKPHNDQIRKRLWVWYLRCKHAVPDFTRMIPAEGWDILWSTQSKESEKNAERARHLKVLADDKNDAKWPLTTEERMVQIEALYLDGDHDQALTQWKSMDEEQTHPDHKLLEMGIRMFSLSGLFTEAEVLVRRLFNSNEHSDPRAILPLIRALCYSPEQTDINRSWYWYEQFRLQIGSDVTMADFDEITNAFFAAGRPKYALATFRDMMLTGEDDTAIHPDEASKRISQHFYQAKGLADINEVALETVGWLPKKFRNKFFYGSWIKKLIGDGELDAVVQVIELMYETGVAPDAKYLNGLIGAWLREGTNESRQKAERLARSMIQKRIDIVNLRSSLPSKDHDTLAETPSTSLTHPPIPVFILRSVPAGTTETWCVLAEYYMSADMLDQVRTLRDLMAEAQLPMPAYFMNLLLRAELRIRGYRRVWSRFQVMTKTVKPDIESWTILWECMSRHMDTSNKDPNGFPRPRELFRHMAEWLDCLDASSLQRAQREIDTSSLNAVMLALSLARDLNGLFVALHMLSSRLGVLPDEKTAHTLIMVVARLDAPKSIARSGGLRRRNLRVSKNAENTANIGKAGQVIELIRQHRLQTLQEHGLDPQEFSRELGGLENTRTLLSFLHAILQQREGAIKLADVCAEMGFSAIDVDKATGFDGIVDDF